MTAPTSLHDMAPVIEIRDLHKAYGELEVLKGVSITAPARCGVQRGTCDVEGPWPWSPSR